MPANVIRDPPQDQATNEQPKQRRPADHPGHKRRQEHGGGQLDNGVTDNAEDVAVNQMRAEG